MKRLFAIFFFALIAFIPAKAQVKLGVSLDPQVSWMSSDRKKIEGDGSVGGISFGLNVEKYYASKYALYSGLFFESTGGYLKYKDGDIIDSKDQDGYQILPGQSMKYRLQYITIPVGLKLKTNPIGYNSFFANLGLKTSFLAKSKGFSSNKSGMDGEVLDGVMHNVNIGWQVGVGTEYALGGDVFLLFGITYNNGLTNVLNNSSVHINLNNVTLKVGVMF